MKFPSLDRFHIIFGEFFKIYYFRRKNITNDFCIKAEQDYILLNVRSQSRSVEKNVYPKSANKCFLD